MPPIRCENAVRAEGDKDAVQPRFQKLPCGAAEALLIRDGNAGKQLRLQPIRLEGVQPAEQRTELFALDRRNGIGKDRCGAVQTKIFQRLGRKIGIHQNDLCIIQQGKIALQIRGGDSIADCHIVQRQRHVAVRTADKQVGRGRRVGDLKRVGDVDPQLTGRRRDALTEKVVAQCGQKADVHTEKAQIPCDILPDAAETHRDLARVGVLGDQCRSGNAADVHIRAADDRRIAPAAQDVALSGDVALFHQVGNVYGDRGAGDTCHFRKAFLRDHGVCLDPLQDLPFTLCHAITA